MLGQNTKKNNTKSNISGSRQDVHWQGHLNTWGEKTSFEIWNKKKQFFLGKQSFHHDFHLEIQGLCFWRPNLLTKNMFWKGYPVNSWQSTMGCFETIILPHEQTWTHWKLIKFVISSFQCHRGKHPIGICLLYLWKKKTAIYQKSKCTFLWMPIFSSELVSPLFPTISTPFILFLHPVIATENKEIF